MDRIAIIGDGGWGTALALHLERSGRRVRVWSPFPEAVERLRRARENTPFLPGVPLPESLEWTADCEAAVAGAEGIVLAVPSKFCGAVYAAFADAVRRGAARLLSASKGLDPVSGRRLTELAGAVFGRPAAALSGPTLAEEVARGLPAAAVLAGECPADVAAWQAALNGPRFRVYTSDDTAGVELGGALKNVMALAAGASDGLGFGENARAALITRGLAEMTRLGAALGARAETFAGLSGMGDLVVTCNSRASRNHQVGERLGRGEPLAAILGGMRQVAEGVTTGARARDLARARGVRAPIIEAVAAVLYDGQPPAEAVEALLRRAARPERD